VLNHSVYSFCCVLHCVADVGVDCAVFYQSNKRRLLFIILYRSYVGILIFGHFCTRTTNRGIQQMAIQECIEILIARARKTLWHYMQNFIIYCLPRLNCQSNLKSLSLSTTNIWKGIQNVVIWKVWALRGHPRSLKIALIDRAHTIEPSIVTIALYCTVLRNREILVENGRF